MCLILDYICHIEIPSQAREMNPVCFFDLGNEKNTGAVLPAFSGRMDSGDNVLSKQLQRIP